MQIRTDHKWKNLKYRYEVPESVLTRYFDHLTDDDGDGFIHYAKRWWHVSDFMVLDNNTPFPKTWTGYSSDTYFSGALIELSEDGEQYRIGYYFS